MLAGVAIAALLKHITAAPTAETLTIARKISIDSLLQGRWPQVTQNGLIMISDASNCNTVLKGLGVVVDLHQPVSRTCESKYYYILGINITKLWSECMVVVIQTAPVCVHSATPIASETQFVSFKLCEDGIGTSQVLQAISRR